MLILIVRQKTDIPQLIGVELVTYRVIMVVINDMSVVSIIKGLECLQNLRGCLLNLIFDAHKSHMAMTRQTDNTGVDLSKLLQGNTALLVATGIRLTISPAKHHEKVSRAEKAVS